MEGNPQYHQQKFYPCPGSDTVVVLIHGITEGPGQFSAMVQEILRCGYAACCLLLPGHGKTGIDFAQSSMREWVQAVRAAIEEQSQTFRRIFLAGHSLGALLAMHVSLRYPGRIAGIFSVAAPFFIRITLRGAATGLRVAFGSPRTRDPFTCAARATFSITESSPLVYLRWLPRYRELFSFCHVTRQILPLLQVPVTFVFCGRDEYVNPRSFLFVRDTEMRCKKRLVFLKNAGHFYYPEDAEKYMLSVFRQFLKKTGNPEEAK